jgi:hypothetical protein
LLLLHAGQFLAIQDTKVVADRCESAGTEGGLDAERRARNVEVLEQRLLRKAIQILDRVVGSADRGQLRLNFERSEGSQLIVRKNEFDKIGENRKIAQV